MDTAQHGLYGVQVLDPNDRCAGCGAPWVYGDVLPRTGQLCRPGCAERYEALLTVELDGVPPERHAEALSAQRRTWPTLRELERAHGATVDG